MDCRDAGQIDGLIAGFAGVIFPPENLLERLGLGLKGFCNQG